LVDGAAITPLLPKADPEADPFELEVVPDRGQKLLPGVGMRLDADVPIASRTLKN